MHFKINSITISTNTITYIINVGLHNRHKHLTITILILSFQFKHRPTSILPLTQAHMPTQTSIHPLTHTHTHSAVPCSLPSLSQSQQTQVMTKQRGGRESLTLRDKHKCTLQTLQIQQAKVNPTPTHRKANIIFAANGNNLLKAWSVNSGRINSMKGENDHLQRAGNKCHR